MGLLDDAIREHLELLRLRGADPTEIARAEAEALSPAVREVSEPEAAAEDDDLTAGTERIEVAFDDVDDEDLDDDFDGPDHADDPDDGDEPEADVDSPGQQTEHFDVLADEDDLVAEEVAEEEGDLDDPALRAPDAAVEDEDDLELDESDGDPEPADRPDPESERQETLDVGSGDGDVLEGTPDFLEDSPDHDKLWFEQSGPRDFDFDDDRK